MALIVARTRGLGSLGEAGKRLRPIEGAPGGVRAVHWTRRAIGSSACSGEGSAGVSGEQVDPPVGGEQRLGCWASRRGCGRCVAGRGGRPGRGRARGPSAAPSARPGRGRRSGTAAGTSGPARRRSTRRRATPGWRRCRRRETGKPPSPSAVEAVLAMGVGPHVEVEADGVAVLVGVVAPVAEERRGEQRLLGAGVQRLAPHDPASRRGPPDR